MDFLHHVVFLKAQAKNIFLEKIDRKRNLIKTALMAVSQQKQKYSQKIYKWCSIPLQSGAQQS